MDNRWPPALNTGDGVWTQKLPNSALVRPAPLPSRDLPPEVRAWIDNPPKQTSDTPFVVDTVR